MEKVDVEPRLTDLSTQWNLVFLTQVGQPEEAQRAAAQLMCRYAGAVHRYLLKALKDPHAAEELDQEFASDSSGAISAMSTRVAAGFAIT